MSLALKYKSFQRIYVFPRRNHVPDSKPTLGKSLSFRGVGTFA